MPSVPELIRRSNRRIQEQIDRSNERIKNDFDNSIAQTARSVDRTNKAIDKSFEPVKSGFDRTFSKANMNQFDDGLVHVLKESGSILGKVGDVGDKVLNNPITQLLGAVPVLGEAIGAARLINTGLKAGGAVTTGLSGIADRKNYDKQSGAQVTGNVLERTANTATNVAGTGIAFH